MTDTVITEGGCLCGAIRYRVQGTALSTSLCHCRSCRLASGGPTLAWAIFRKDDVEFLRGRPTEYRSSPPAVRGFCGVCGTALTYRTDKRPNQLDICSATFDRPERFAPMHEIYVAERIVWQPVSEGLRQFAGSSRPE